MTFRERTFNYLKKYRKNVELDFDDLQYMVNCSRDSLKLALKELACQNLVEIKQLPRANRKKAKIIIKINEKNFEKLVKNT